MYVYSIYYLQIYQIYLLFYICHINLWSQHKLRTFPPNPQVVDYSRNRIFFVWIHTLLEMNMKVGQRLLLESGRAPDTNDTNSPRGQLPVNCAIKWWILVAGCEPSE